MTARAQRAAGACRTRRRPDRDPAHRCSACYLAFTKRIPFTDRGYEVKAVFANAQNIAEKSPVRIAGVNVGEVTEVEPMARVERRRGDDDDRRRGPADPRRRPPAAAPAALPRGQPLHRRAARAARARPRCDERRARSRSSRPRNSVQLDQILTTLQADVRGNLQLLLHELGNASREVRRRRGPARAQPEPAARLQEHRAGQRGPARHRAGRPLRPDPQLRPRRDRAQPQPAAAAGPDHQPAHRHRLLRRRGRGAARARSASCPACSTPPGRHSPTSTPPSRRCAPSPARRCPACASTGADDRRRAALHPPAARRWSRAPSCAA